MNYLIDLDGTIYKGDIPIPYAKEFIEYLNENKRKFLMLTNCPKNDPALLVEKLAKMGIKVQEENILTSGQATAAYIKQNTTMRKVFLVGGKALEKELLDQDLEIVEEKPDCIVVGFDEDLTYVKLRKATQWIIQGAAFICTNEDATIPEGESIVPHTGAIAASIEKATGVKPLVIGKPEEYILHHALKKLGCSREECCIIGDRLDTDIEFGQRNGVPSYLVLTGVTNAMQAEESPVKSTRVFKNLNEVIEYDRKIHMFMHL